MRTREDEEFELVLGNKQLISLFFLVVLLFAVFFAFGYTMGVRQGEDQVLLAEASTLASVNPPADAAQAPPTGSPQPATSAPAPAPVAAPPSTEPKPTATQKPTTPVAKATPKPPPPKPKTQTPPPAKPSPRSAARDGKPVGESIHLQIAAFREPADAGLLANELLKQGHKAEVFNRGDEWRRVVIGPFPNVAAAKTYQRRLKGEGMDSLLRVP